MATKKKGNKNVFCRENPTHFECIIEDAVRKSKKKGKSDIYFLTP